MSCPAVTDFTIAIRDLASASRRAAQQFSVLADIINEHREQWLCEGEGQWPDKFTLLNRYARTDCEPPFIFND